VPWVSCSDIAARVGVSVYPWSPDLTVGFDDRRDIRTTVRGSLANPAHTPTAYRSSLPHQAGRDRGKGRRPFSCGNASPVEKRVIFAASHPATCGVRGQSPQPSPYPLCCRPRVIESWCGLQRLTRFPWSRGAPPFARSTRWCTTVAIRPHLLPSLSMYSQRGCSARWRLRVMRHGFEA
jgi:hypothetical protein